MIKQPIALLLSLAILLGSCADSPAESGTLQGKVTIGPISPVERPGEKPDVPQEVFEARKIMVYEEDGDKLVAEVDIEQKDKTSEGFYTVDLGVGTYLVDIKHIGVDSSDEVPVKVEVNPGEITILDIDIDTGIR
jgi:hypothetical protein